MYKSIITHLLIMIIEFGFSQKDSNDRMDFICDEDIGNVEKPSSWSAALAILKENYTTSMVLRAFAELIGRSVFVVTANGVSSQNIFFYSLVIMTSYRLISSLYVRMVIFKLKYNFVEAPSKFIIAELSIRKLGSSSEAGIQVYHSSEDKLFRSLCTHKDRVNKFQKPGVYCIPCECVVWFTLGETS